MRVGAAHGGGQQRRRLIEQRAVSHRTFLHGAERMADPLQDRVFEHKKFLDLLRFLTVVGKVVVVAAEVRLLEAFPERNLNGHRTGRIGLQCQDGKIQQGGHVIIDRLAVEVLNFIIHLRLGTVCPVGATFHGLLHLADRGQILVQLGAIVGIQTLLHGLRLVEHRVQNATVLGKDLLLRRVVFVDLEKQVKDFARRVDLLHRQPVFIP